MANDTEDTVRGRMYESDRKRINDRRQGGETQADVIRRLLDSDASDVGVSEGDVPESMRVEEERVLAELEHLKDAVERVPERTAEELGARQR